MGFLSHSLTAAESIPTESIPSKRRRPLALMLLPFCFGILATILSILVYVAFNLGKDGNSRIRHFSSADTNSRDRLVLELGRPSTTEGSSSTPTRVADKIEAKQVHVVDNHESNIRGQQSFHTSTSSEGKEKHIWTPTKYTTCSHIVAGVNLASYGVLDVGGNDVAPSRSKPFELYEEFNIGPKVSGAEDWWDIQEMKRHQGMFFQSLTFYVDKIAQKRWLPTIGYDIPKIFALRYNTEIKVRQGAVKNIIPIDTSFVAKASHFSESQGVTIVECCEGNRHQKVGRMLRRRFGGEGKVMTTFDPLTGDYRGSIAQELAEYLEHTDSTSEDAQLRLTPGIVIEERFLIPGDSPEGLLAALEFKCFVIWGRFWISHYRRGGHDHGYWDREGRMVYKKSERKPFLPDFVDWTRIVRMAEERAKHMDLLRVDIYVGKGSASLQRPETRYVLSEVESEQTSTFDELLHDEGARLIIAGYKIGNYRLVENNEIPRVYFENGLRLPSNYTEVCQQNSDNELCKGRYSS